MKAPFVKLAVALLRGSGDAFGNHGCNDFDLSPYLTHEQQVEFVTLAHKFNGDPEEIERSVKKLPWVADFSAMYACADILEKLP